MRRARGPREPRTLAGLIEDVQHLVEDVAALEVRIAGRTEPAAHELLARLNGASRHLAAARKSLAGIPTNDHAPEVDHLQGSSRAVPFQDLMCFLATTRKSGLLRVETEGERFLVQLQEGAVVYATGDAPPTGEGLGELLAANGVQSTDLLGRLPDAMTETAWIDRNLVGTSWISSDSLAGAIQQQTRLSFFRLCSADSTRFRFYEGAEIQNVVPVKQSAMELLLEYTRAVDERTGRPETRVVHRKAPALSLRPADPSPRASAG